MKYHRLRVLGFSSYPLPQTVTSRDDSRLKGLPATHAVTVHRRVGTVRMLKGLLLCCAAAMLSYRVLQVQVRRPAVFQRSVLLSKGGSSKSAVSWVRRASSCTGHLCFSSFATSQQHLNATQLPAAGSLFRACCTHCCNRGNTEGSVLQCLIPVTKPAFKHGHSLVFAGRSLSRTRSSPGRSLRQHLSLARHQVSLINMRT
jgi:hypothetical protein